MVAFVIGLGLGVAIGWVAFEKPEFARKALDWVVWCWNGRPARINKPRR